MALIAAVDVADVLQAHLGTLPHWSDFCTGLDKWQL